jgi:hypothetical protein
VKIKASSTGNGVSLRYVIRDQRDWVEISIIRSIVQTRSVGSGKVEMKLERKGKIATLSWAKEFTRTTTTGA